MEKLIVYSLRECGIQRKDRSLSRHGKSAAKGQTLSFASGCSNHNLTVSVSGKQITTTTKTVWS